MIKGLFIKRIFTNKIYWFAVAVALILLLGGVIYTNPISGERYTFWMLLYDEEIQNYLQSGMVSIKSILIGYGLNSYLWMFSSIIVGIPCILTQKVERFVLFRTSKMQYFLSKYISNLILGGCIMVAAHLLFATVATGVEYWLYSSLSMPFLQEPVWDIYLVRKLMSVFCQGMANALPGILLAEFLQNKYLILCIPFVWNYFINMFVSTIIPNSIWRYITPENYEMLLFHEPLQMFSSIFLLVLEIFACGAFIKCIVERRCDCGQE